MNQIEKDIQDLNAKHSKQAERLMNEHSRLFMEFRPATKQEDCEMGFDMVYKPRDIEIAMRIRKHQYIKFSDFTIRACTRFGGKTEIDKIREGCGDYYFYAWETPSGKSIQQYMIIDLAKVRDANLLPVIGAREIRINGDGTGFVSISIEELRKANALKVFES